MVDLFCSTWRRAPVSIVLDIDDAFDAVHGQQQLSLFNAHYDERCFLPIHIYEGTRFHGYLESEQIGLSAEQVRNDVIALSTGLANLPRITREFLVIMIERRETVRRRGIRHDDMEINADVLVCCPVVNGHK